MLFRILKLFGLDVPARVEAAPASLEGRVDRVIDCVGDLAQGAVLLAILGIAALVTTLMAAAAGLVAVYRLTADAYGDYAGLGVVAAILVAVTLILLALMIAKVRSLEAPKVTTISPTSDAPALHVRSAAAEPAIADAIVFAASAKAVAITELLQRSSIHTSHRQPDRHAADGTPTWRRLGVKSRRDVDLASVGSKEPRPQAGASCRPAQIAQKQRMKDIAARPGGDDRATPVSIPIDHLNGSASNDD